MCFEKKANLTNVFDNDLAYPKRYDVFQAYDDTAAHYWLCPECKNRVLDEFRETKK